MGRERKAEPCKAQCELMESLGYEHSTYLDLDCGHVIWRHSEFDIELCCWKENEVPELKELMSVALNEALNQGKAVVRTHLANALGINPTRLNGL